MKEIRDFFNLSNLMISSRSEGRVDCPFQLSPENYLKFAEQDLINSDTKSLVNSLSNLKRAVDCQLDFLMLSFGYYDKAKKENWSIPKKIKLLNDIGLMAPRILEKLNRKRNEIEHDFTIPSKEEVEDFLDIAILFIHYTKKYTDRDASDLQIHTIEGFENNMLDEPQVNITWDYPNKIYKFQYYFKKKKEEILLNPNDECFIDYLKCYIKALNL